MSDLLQEARRDLERERDGLKRRGRRSGSADGREQEAERRSSSSSGDSADSADEKGELDGERDGRSEEFGWSNETEGYGAWGCVG